MPDTKIRRALSEQEIQKLGLTPEDVQIVYRLGLNPIDYAAEKAEQERKKAHFPDGKPAELSAAPDPLRGFTFSSAQVRALAAAVPAELSRMRRDDPLFDHYCGIVLR